MYVYILTHWSSGSSVHQCPRRPGFSPRSGHTKDSKIAT